MTNKIQIVLPKGMLGPNEDDDALSLTMRAIAFAFAPDDADGWSDPSKYGIDFENDVFKMHPFCWCERDDCLWCGKRCGCDRRDIGYFLDGKEVSKRAYDEWHTTIVRPLPWKAPGVGFDDRGTPKYKRAEREFDAYIKERDRRSGRIFRAVIHTCGLGVFCDRPKDVWDIYARPPYPTSAAHFWFKPSGFRVWWYKYIGRDMEVDGEAPADLLDRVFATHPKGMTASDALRAVQEEGELRVAAMTEIMARMFGGEGGKEGA
jgi:hypothetical protein